MPQPNQQQDNILDLLSRVKRHRTTAPTHTPKNFLDQIEFYHNGADYKIYVYLDGTWKSTSLT
jgi:hypothetical protein